MEIPDIVQQLLREDAQHLSAFTAGCGSCRKFIRRLRRQPRLAVGWDDIPPPLLERVAVRLHQRLFQH